MSDKEELAEEQVPEDSQPEETEKVEKEQTQEEQKTEKKPRMQIKKNLPEPDATETNEIQVYVTDPVVKDGISKYILYTIRGEDREGPFEVPRRYSDFDKVREVLFQRWPACYIPPIPPKKSVGNMDQAFIEERRRGLELFTHALTKMKHLWYSEEWKIFLRSTTDLEKTLNSLPKQTHDQVIEKYGESFNQLSGKEINTELIVKINSFSQYLKKIVPMLTNYQTMASNLVSSRTQHDENFETFYNFLIPEYEKNCLSEYVESVDGKFIFAETNNQKYDEIKSTLKEFTGKNEFVDLEDLIKFEIREIEAFQQTMKKKDEYEQLKNAASRKQKDYNIEKQQVMAGKKSFGGLFSKKTKEETLQELNTKIETADKEVENLSFICDIMTVILGYVEIDNFKADKEKKYFKLLNKLAQFEKEYAKAREELWNHALEHPNIP